MKKILFFSGLPGVGKSTLLRRFSERIGSKIIDIDDFKKINVDPVLVKSQIDPPELRWSYYQKALEVAFDFLNQKSMVLMDEVFHLHSLRVQVENVCKENNVRFLWVEVRCSYDVVKERLQATNREGHILSTEEALKMHLLFREIFEGFNGSLHHIVIDNDDEEYFDIDQLIEMVNARI